MGTTNSVFAFAGKIPRINLSSGKIHTEPTVDYADSLAAAVEKMSADRSGLLF